MHANLNAKHKTETEIVEGKMKGNLVNFALGENVDPAALSQR
jgi:hypothetical protein